MTATVRAQAKVNLVLHVVARETSGYHSIETVFLRLDLADVVRVRPATGRTIDCSGPLMPASGLGPAEKNLAYRAACAYTDAAGWPTGFAIEIEKHIPVGGGLGGGSTDAGAVLRALDALSPRPLGAGLIEIAGLLGADVPFLADEHAMALGWGRGERLLALPAPPSRAAVIVVPDFGVGTADAYGWLAASRNGYDPVGRVLRLEDLGDWESLATLAANDFSRVVAARHPVLAELTDELRSHGAALSMMSGSGSAVFGIFDEPPDAAAIGRSTGLSVIATRTAEQVERVRVDR